MTLLTSKFLAALFALSLSVLPISNIAYGQEGSSGSSGSSASSDTTTSTSGSIRNQLKAEKEARQAALKAAKEEANAERKLTKTRELASKLIAERQKALNRLSDAGQTKKCRAAAKADVTAAIATVTARLAAQNTALTSLKTVDEIKTSIKSDIIGKNHVFVVFLPAVRGMCVADRLISLIETKLTPLSAKLKDAGLDTTTLDAELAAAKTDFEAAYAGYKAIASNPGTSTAKADLAAPKAKLKSGKQHLSLAKAEAGKLKESLPAGDDDTTVAN